MSTVYKFASAIILSFAIVSFFGTGITHAQSAEQQIELDGLVGPGDRGEQVRQIQELLAQRPDIYPEGLVTGYYGELTARAVSRLQAEAGLPQVGRVGQQTLNYLLSNSDRPTEAPPTPDTPGLPDATTQSELSANLTVEPSTNVDVGQRINVDASGSTDPEGDRLVYSWKVDTPRGSGNTDGFISLSGIQTSFQQPGMATFQVTVRDEDGNTDSDTVNIQVGDQNPSQDGQPVAVNDNYAVTAGNTLDVGTAEGVLANDNDPDNDDLQASSLNRESNYNGISADLDSDGSFTINVEDDYAADIARFTYRVSDNDGSDQGQIVVNVRDGDDSDEDSEPIASLGLEKTTHVLEVGYSAQRQNYDMLVNVLNALRGVTVSEYAYDRGEIGINVTRNPSELFQTIVRAAGDRVQEPGDNIQDLRQVAKMTVGVGEEFTVTAENSRHPDGDQLEYQWNVDTPRGSGGGNFSDRFQFSDSFDNPGTATFELTVRDEDGNTDTESLTVQVGETDDPESYDDQLILNRTVGNITEFPIILGDVDGDGSVTPEDADLIGQYVNGNRSLSQQQQSAADVNGDDKVTGVDVNEVMAYATDNRRFNNQPDSPTQFPIILGDVNQNGSISTADASLIRDYVRGDADLSTQQLNAADVNGDGRVTADIDDRPERETITLTDTYRDTFEFTATVTRMTDTEFRYVVEGSVPSPNYSMEVLTDGPQIIASIEQGTGAAPAVVTDVRETGRFSIDSNAEAEEISFDVRGGSDSGGASAPTARLSVAPPPPVMTGQQVRIDARGSTDPNGEQLEYRWEVDTPSDSGSSEDFSDRSRLNISFNEPGMASFEVTVRDQDGNTDSDSVTVNVVEQPVPSDNQPPEATNDSYDVTAGDSLEVSAQEGLLANDTDADDEDLRVVDSGDINRVSNYRGVEADFAPDGSFYISVDEDYGGDLVRYSYQVTDGEDSDRAGVVIDVRDNDGESEMSDSEMILERTVGGIDEFPASQILLGDVDQDGTISTADVSLIQEYVNGETDLTFRQKTAADVDGDGEISATDDDESSDIIVR